MGEGLGAGDVRTGVEFVAGGAGLGETLVVVPEFEGAAGEARGLPGLVGTSAVSDFFGVGAAFSSDALGLGGSASGFSGDALSGVGLASGRSTETLLVLAV